MPDPSGPPLTLLVLRVADLDASRSFYTLLGFTFHLHRHGAGPEHYAGAGLGYTLELYPGRPTPTGPGWVFRLGLSVPSVDAILPTSPPAPSSAHPAPPPWATAPSSSTRTTIASN